MKPTLSGRLDLLYALTHDVKQWRGVATRYAKRSASFLAICQIRALVLWTKLF